MKDPYRVVVYYHGPQSSWSGKLNENEIIFEIIVRWLGVARLVAKINCGNKGRCGYVIMQGEQIIEHIAAMTPAYAQVSA